MKSVDDRKTLKIDLNCILQKVAFVLRNKFPFSNVLKGTPYVCSKQVAPLSEPRALNSFIKIRY